jgi:hypothetical protein
MFGERATRVPGGVLFSGTVRDNLEIGTRYDDDELWAALRDGGADRSCTICRTGSTPWSASAASA